MATSNGQITAELFKYNTQIHYIYQPTGIGDWFRWRTDTWKTFNDAQDATYNSLDGVWRGNIYSGGQSITAESDSNTGLTSGGTLYNYNHLGSGTFGDHRTFIVANHAVSPNKCRIWSRYLSSRSDVAIVFLNGASAEISREIVDTALGTGLGYIEPSSWFDIPDGTVSVKITKNIDDGNFIQIVGIDFIDTATVISPDTAGSLMFDGIQDRSIRQMTDGDAVAVCFDAQISTLNHSVSTSEFGLFWAIEDGSFASANAIGGNSHQGIVIGAGSITWETQSGTGAVAAWSPSAGDKILADYLILKQTGYTAYLQSLGTTQLGTYTGKMIFDNSGCVFENLITATVISDLFVMYNSMCPLPVTANRIYFEGEDDIRTASTSTLQSSTKSQTVSVWDAVTKTLYEMKNYNPEDNHNYYIDAVTGDTAAPRVAYVPAGGGIGATRKMYMNKYRTEIGNVENERLQIGESIGSKWKLSLRDISLDQESIVIDERLNRKQFGF